MGGAEGASTCFSNTSDDVWGCNATLSASQCLSRRGATASQPYALEWAGGFAFVSRCGLTLSR
jgi:hypothetical protein